METKIDTKKIIAEITDDLVKKGLTNIKEIKIEPFAIGVHANVSISFYERKKDAVISNLLPKKCESCGCRPSTLYHTRDGVFCKKCKPS